MQEAPRHFLDVTSSITSRAWVDRLDTVTGRIAAAISQRSELPDILARVIAGRGIGIEEASTYLEPTIRNLMPDPSTLTAMDALAERIAKAVTDSENVALFGDYD